jgi:hypothetical protein
MQQFMEKIKNLEKEIMRKEQKLESFNKGILKNQNLSDNERL